MSNLIILGDFLLSVGVLLAGLAALYFVYSRNPLDK